MKKEVVFKGKHKCSCCGRSPAQVRWQGFHLCLACRVEIAHDETLQKTLLGVGNGSGGKRPSRVRYLSCPSCQRRVTRQYAFGCVDCAVSICIYCAAPENESMCMGCSDKRAGAGAFMSANGSARPLRLYKSTVPKARRRGMAEKS